MELRRRQHTPPDRPPSGRSEPVETHPAIAEPPPCVADRHWAVDRVLFAIAAAMALGFVAWGFVSPSGLGTASGSVLTWVTGNLGWLFVLLASAFVVFVIWLAAGKYGR